MELKIIATILDETGVDSGGILRGLLVARGEKAYPHSM